MSSFVSICIVLSSVLIVLSLAMPTNLPSIITKPIIHWKTWVERLPHPAYKRQRSSRNKVEKSVQN